MIRRALTPVAAFTIVLAGCSSGGGEGERARPAAAPADAPRAPSTPAGVAPVTPAVVAPASARDAVEAFLTASVEGAVDTTYALLSAGDRERFTPVEWQHAQADLPRYVGFTVRTEQPRLDGGGTEVLVDAELRSQLDEIVGLVPARGVAVWTAVPEDGGWRVDLGRSRLTPVLPPESAAPGAVTAWADARRQCQPATEYRSLVGSPNLADALCGRDGPVATGAVRTLDALADASPVVNAFGPEAATWARVVDVARPAALQVVVAPVDDEWLVVGVTRPPA
jgi:hypothetical protein